MGIARHTFGGIAETSDLTEMTMTDRTRKWAKLTTLAAAGTAGFGLMWAPTAGADVLGNGIDMNCKPDSSVHATCVAGGCPRVHGDYVVDAIHFMVDGGSQEEFGFKCINGATASFGFPVLAGNTSRVGVQACRKKDLEGDWCTAWADYVFTTPAAPQQAPAPVQAPPPPVQQAPPPPVQQAPPPDVTNAIQASFGDPGLTTLAFNVTNTSNLTATCNYTATADTLNPLVPKKTTRQFNVPANGNHTETFSGAPTGTTYNSVLSCKDASGTQKAELGHVETSVRW